jgi:ABC-2 type transport system permease protein
MTPVANALWSSLRREWTRLRADPWDLAMLTSIPIALYLLTWWIFSAGVARDLPLVVRDLDHSVMSRSLIRMLDQSPGLKVVVAANTDTEAFHLIRERKAFGVLSIPADLQRTILGGRSATLQWAYNAQFAAHTGGMTRDVRAVVGTLSAGIELQGRAKRGAATVQAREQVEPVRTRAAALFNENGSYIASLALPMAFSLMHIFITLAAVTAIGREFRAATVAEWLAAANGKLGAAMLGKLLIPFLAFVVHSALLVLLFGVMLGWPIVGSATSVLLGTAFFISAYLAMGAFIVAATSSLRSALSICAFVTAPAFAFSGQGFPMLAMPLGARIWADALPLTHYLPLMNNTWLAGAPLRFGVVPMAVLLLFTIGFGGAAYLRLSRRVRQPDTWGKL